MVMILNTYATLTVAFAYLPIIQQSMNSSFTYTYIISPYMKKQQGGKWEIIDKETSENASDVSKNV